MREHRNRKSKGRESGFLIFRYLIMDLKGKLTFCRFLTVSEHREKFRNKLILIPIF